MNIMPISSLGSPVSSMAFLTARTAATSTGGLMGRRWGIRLGKRTRIRRTTDGHAVLIRGSCSSCSDMYCLVASLTSSAAALTSNTSSKPISSSALSTIFTSSRLLNWLYRDGAGSATVYLYFFITSSLS